MRSFIVLVVVVGAAVAAIACNDKRGGEASKANAASSASTAAATLAPATASASATASAAPKPPGEKIEIQIASVANEMRYDKTSLTVPTGAEVHLVLKNNATIDTMPHNWVLVTPGTEAKIALEGLNKAPKDGYVVAGPDVYAYTPLAPPGKTSEITFTAPAPGKYAYICTFPGHYLLMKGVLTVTP